ncbi:MAG: hypothetical protein Alpg2KO_23440 [Alphaproteobacteria bacterium]
MALFVGPFCSMVSIRPFPYPFRAMMAISTDIDSTTTDNLRYIHRVLKADPLKPPLDVADSVWGFATGAHKGNQIAFYDMKSGNLTPYWKELKYYINNKWIDTLHTWGNFSLTASGGNDFTRAYAEKVHDLFKREGISFKVWVNHGDEGNIQNFGNARYMQGDRPKSDAYHTDLMLDLGVKYAWMAPDHRTVSHKSMLRPLELKDGNKIWGFPRYHSYDVTEEDRAQYVEANCKFWGADQKNAVLWYTDQIHMQIQKRHLDHLVENQEFSIATQHLGYVKYSDNAFLPQALAAFDQMRDYEAAGKVKIAATSRLLEYNRVREFVKYEVIDLEDRQVINITHIDDPVLGRQDSPDIETLAGLTFYCDSPGKCFIAVNGTLLKASRIQRNDHDGIGYSIGVKWHGLPADDLPSRYALPGEMRSHFSGERTSPVSQDLSQPPKRESTQADGAVHKQNADAASPSPKVKPKSLYERALEKAAGIKSGPMPSRVTPLICIGGMKCGTTSLWSILPRHPQIHGCVMKEPSYFGRDTETAPLSREQYFSLWSWPEDQAEHVAAFEASTHYAKYPARSDVAEQMLSILPDARLVYVMRNPVRRLESQLAHHISRGEMPEDTFTSGAWKDKKHLFNLSRYALQLDQFADYKARDALFLTSLEELISQTGKVLDGIAAFAGLDRFEDWGDLPKSNTRRSDNNAGSVNFTDEDRAFVRQQLSDDLDRLASRYGFDTSIWSL